MALIFEDSEKVTKKQIYIPQNAKKVFKAMGKIYKPYIDKNLDGSKIMKSLSSETQYNKKGDTSNKNGQKKHDSVSVEDAKVRLHRQEKLNPNSVEYQLYGGQLAHDILKKGIEGARGVKTVDAVKPPKPTVSKPNVSKDLKKDGSKMKLSNPKIKLECKENKARKIYIRENQLLKLNAVTERTDLPRKTRDEGKKRANKQKRMEKGTL